MADQKVYVLMYVDYDDFALYGVYTTPEKAEEGRKTIIKKKRYLPADRISVEVITPNVLLD